MIDRVEVFIAGVQKAGTTALFSYLSEHQRLVPGIAKELHFFDDELHDWQSGDYSSYHAHFVPRPGQDQTCMAFDVTPIYAFWPTALARIHSYNPDARIILIHRDPIERAWSHWRMERQRGAETLSFSEAIREGRRRLDQAAPLDNPHRVFTYVERGYYARQLDHVLSVFPQSQVLLLTSGMLDRQPQDVLQRIAAFLGISPFGPVAPRREHVGTTSWPAPDGDDIAYLRDLFIDDTLRFARMTNLPLEDWPTLNRAVSLTG